MAFKYLSWILTPLLIGYAIYSLMYEEHRGWYSWTLGMCYGYLLMFGKFTATGGLTFPFEKQEVVQFYQKLPP